jgi:head-tail adaptor
MTAKADFTEQEWEQVLEGPTSAGMLVITAQRGGTIRETVSMAKAYAEARQQHGQSELLDAIVSAKPEIDHTRYHSPEELKQHTIAHLRDAVSLLQDKATAQELDEYKRFTVALAERVAAAHRENGRDQDPVSDAEKAAITEIVEALG